MWIVYGLTNPPWVLHWEDCLRKCIRRLCDDLGGCAMTFSIIIIIIIIIYIAFTYCDELRALHLHIRLIHEALVPPWKYLRNTGNTILKIL